MVAKGRTLIEQSTWAFPYHNNHKWVDKALNIIFKWHKYFWKLKMKELKTGNLSRERSLPWEMILSGLIPYLVAKD